MPRKLRELKADLRRAGFMQLKGRGKGSHSVWKHPELPMVITLSGSDGEDADRYQERDLRNALRALKDLQDSQKEVEE